MGGNKSPAVAPENRLVVRCQTPAGGRLADVEVTIEGTRPTVKTGANGQVEFTFKDSELKAQATPGVVTVRAHKHHFGPPSATVVPGDRVQPIPIFKTKNPVLILELVDVGLIPFKATFDNIPARELSLQQARDALLALHARGDIVLIPEPVIKHDASGTCTPLLCTVQTPKVGERVGMKASNVAGAVQFTNIEKYTDPQAHTFTTSNPDFSLLDARNAVGLFRLANKLKTAWGATTIFHIGISGSDPTVRNDCHGQGRAIDFGGAEGTHPTRGVFRLLVVQDWSDQPVFKLPIGTGRSTSNKWPSGDRTLTYRLDPPSPFGSQIATDFFLDVYNFALAQYSDKTEFTAQSDPPSRIGEGGRTMHPDHNTSDTRPPPGGKNGREAHFNHMHLQVGPTGTA